MVGRLYAAVVCIELLGWCSLAAAQGPLSAPVFGATLENQRFDGERNEISFDLVNNTMKPITMYELWVVGTGPNGTEHLCGGMGQDMIDWSGPPPGMNHPASWTDGWIKPNERQRVVRSADNCLSHMPSVVGARAQLDLISFDDGTGDGNPDEMAFYLSERRYERDEMTKWTSRFTALLKDPEFGNLASQLYRDLVQASHDGELDPDIADTNRARSAQAVRNELKGIALEIREYSKTGKRLSDSAYLSWQIDTLQKRTDRLVRGSGTETETERETNE